MALYGKLRGGIVCLLAVTGGAYAGESTGVASAADVQSVRGGAYTTGSRHAPSMTRFLRSADISGRGAGTFSASHTSGVAAMSATSRWAESGARGAAITTDSHTATAISRHQHGAHSAGHAAEKSEANKISGATAAASTWQWAETASSGMAQATDSRAATATSRMHRAAYINAHTAARFESSNGSAAASTSVTRHWAGTSANGQGNHVFRRITASSTDHLSARHRTATLSGPAAAVLSRTWHATGQNALDAHAGEITGRTSTDHRQQQYGVEQYDGARGLDASRGSYAASRFHADASPERMDDVRGSGTRTNNYDAGMARDVHRIGAVDDNNAPSALNGKGATSLESGANASSAASTQTITRGEFGTGVTSNASIAAHSGVTSNTSAHAEAIQPAMTTTTATPAR